MLPPKNTHIKVNRDYDINHNSKLQIHRSSFYFFLFFGVTEVLNRMIGLIKLDTCNLTEYFPAMKKVYAVLLEKFISILQMLC